MTLWHNGHTVLTAPANTGIPGAETELGTFPVFEHLEETTMSGENPDGSHYEDPGIMWVSYFNGGDALHSFDRALLRQPRRASAASRCGSKTPPRSGPTPRSAPSSRSKVDRGASDLV